MSVLRISEVGVYDTCRALIGVCSMTVYCGRLAELSAQNFIGVNSK